MQGTQQFTLWMTGQVPESQSLEQAKSAFVNVFKVPEEKASLYFQGKPRVLRRNLQEAELQTYTAVLAQAGIPFEVEHGAANTEAQPQAVAAAPEPLVPDPVVPEPAEAPVVKVADSLALVSQEEESQGEEMRCPKCQAQQPKADRCASCGIFVQKFKPGAQPAAGSTMAASRRPRPAADKSEARVEEQADNGPLRLAAIAAVAVLVVLGIWLF